MHKLTQTDARHLSTLPPSAEPIEERSVAALSRKAHVLVAELVRVGRVREAARLRSRLALLQRTDLAHVQAYYMETLEGLERALPVLAGEPELDDDGDRFLVQIGPAPSHVDGAVDESRSRAFRWVAETIALYRPLVG